MGCLFLIIVIVEDLWNGVVDGMVGRTWTYPEANKADVHVSNLNRGWLHSEMQIST